MKFYLIALLFLFASFANVCGIAQDDSFGSEVKDFVSAVYASGDGIGSPYYREREDAVKNDQRDWESHLSEIIESPESDFGLVEAAIEVVQLRESGTNPKIASAIASKFAEVSNRLQQQDRDDLFSLKQAQFVSFTSSILDFGEPTVIQAVLDYAISNREQESPLFTKFTRRALAKAASESTGKLDREKLQKFSNILQLAGEDVPFETNSQFRESLPESSSNGTQENISIDNENGESPTASTSSKLPWILGGVALLVIVIILLRAAKGKGDQT